MKRKLAGEEIRTENLILRPMAGKEDVDAFLKILREDEDSKIFMGINDPEKAQKRLEQHYKKNYPYGEGIFLIFQQEKKKEFIGYIGICINHGGIRDRIRKVGLDCYISKAWRNKGYCTEASETILKRMLEGGYYTSVRTKTLSTNIPCIRVLEKLGFEKINEDFAAYSSEWVDWEDSDSCQQLVSEYQLNYGEEAKLNRKKIWKSPTKILFAEFWFKNKEKLREYFRQHYKNIWEWNYTEILKALIRTVLNPELGFELDTEHMIESFQGDYAVWIIPNLPLADVKWCVWTYMEYGSESILDLWQYIHYNDRMEQNINDYMTISLHLLQRMKPLLTLEEEKMDKRFEEALRCGQGENMMQQLESISEDEGTMYFFRKN